MTKHEETAEQLAARHRAMPLWQHIREAMTIARRFHEFPIEQLHQQMIMEMEDYGIETGEPCASIHSSPPGCETLPEKPRVVHGYDAEFWNNSYRILTDAIDEHLPQLMYDDDVAEEAIYEDAIKQAGLLLKSLPPETGS